MKLGIIGAENSHTAAIAKTINIQKKVKGFTVDYVWGETPRYAKEAAKAGQIPHIVKTPLEMLGKVDAVLVDHRHPKYHLKAVLPFVKAGVPTFVDKPFCYRSKEGKEFLKVARQKKTPVTSFSVVPEQQSFKRFVRKMKSLGPLFSADTYGPCDPKSPYGGVFFYGIHQVDMVLRAFGYNPTSVLITKNGKSSTGQILYPGGFIATMHLVSEDCPGFTMSVLGKKGSLHAPITFDSNQYLVGIKKFTSMF